MERLRRDTSPPAGEDKPPRSKPRNPWLPDGNAGSTGGPRRAANIEDLFGRRGRGGPGGGPGGGGGNFPRMPQAPGGKSWVPLIVVAVIAFWILLTSFHMIGPKEQGIVTTFGKYERTLRPGVSFTLPWPIQQVEVEDVTSIRRDTIPEGEGEKLMLTGDQNLVDLSYLIRWNIKDLKLYTFQLAEPDETVQEVAEAAMRAAVAEVTLDEALSGAGRAEIERSVAANMQALLDAYRSGVTIQGVEIKKADPPTQVIDAFREVLAAQQDAQSDINRARAWAEQVTRPRRGRGAGIRRGVRAIPPRPRSDAPPPVLRNHGARVAPDRQHRRRDRWRRTLSAPSRDPAQQPAQRPPARRRTTDGTDLGTLEAVDHRRGRRAGRRAVLLHRCARNHAGGDRPHG